VVADSDVAMLTTTPSISPVLNSLIGICKDGQNGFRIASDDVHALPLKSVFFEFSSQRARFVSELESLMVGLGEKADDDGSLAGVLHRAWIDLRSAISSGDEKTVVAECVRGDETALGEYEDALRHEELPQHVRLVITQQAGEVRRALQRMRALQEDFPV
jgi:uncharacterized protein (TIGR02284 family)